MQSKQSTAVIGTGISGMGAAYLLHPSNDLTVYEQGDYIGGHTRTREVDYEGTRIAVDTGFIVFNNRNYPHLSALFKRLNVPVEKSNMSFAISVQQGAFEWGARSLNAVFGQRSNLLSPRFWGMIADVKRFFREAPALLETQTTLSLGELLEQMKMGEGFRRYFLLPMGGAIWSCPVETMLDFPALTFVRFFHNHGLLTFNDQPQWYTVSGGAREYVSRLTAPFRDSIRLNCGVTSVKRTENGVEITDVTGQTKPYDRVVFACHGDQALRLLQDATTNERAVLGAFTYQKNTAFLHRDIRQMPKRRACWASWVYASDGASRPDALAVTYWMNLLQNIDERTPLFVTLNPITPIPEALIFDQTEFEHPVFSAQAIAAQARIHEIQGTNRAWFCGAYQRYGFHEDGLNSAVEMAALMGVSPPWQ
ncbi:MAG: FAD-dependent oxidoreductase [Rickettsiales bacterium]|nr:FAD-dependent oxidoreductase [Rickettsiales bacterium]